MYVIFRALAIVIRNWYIRTHTAIIYICYFLLKQKLLSKQLNSTRFKLLCIDKQASSLQLFHKMVAQINFANFPEK